MIEHNLIGTINLLEYCKRAGAGFIMLSTSRVYSRAPPGGVEDDVRERCVRSELVSMSTSLA